MRAIGSAWVQLLIATVVLLLSSRPSFAAPPEAVDPYRQALLIGVWDYARGAAPKLQPMDADLIALEKAFHDAGFDHVESLPNPTQAQMQSALDLATQRAEDEGTSRATLTVVYFAGHGAMVGHDSFLLAKDYLPPVSAPEIVLQGGIDPASIGKTFAKFGQPAILIVEACRNAYVPGANAVRLPDNGADDTPEVTSPEMIAAPGPVSGYGVFFAQEPGQPVQLAPRPPGQPSLLASAIKKYMPQFRSASLLFSAVGQEIMEKSSYPLSPEYLDKLTGDLRISYDPDSVEKDRKDWLEAEAQGRDFVTTFVRIYRTSRYLPVARQWLVDNPEPMGQENFVVYSRSLQKYLGAKPRSWLTRTVPEVLTTQATIGTGEDRVRVQDIALIQRSDAENKSTFEVQTIDNHTLKIEGSAIAADPTTVPRYWQNGTEQIVCDVDVINSGNCPQVTQLAELARNEPDQRGTIYVAAVFNIATRPEPIDVTFSRMRAIGDQLDKLGIPRGRVRFRSFFEADLVAPVNAPILVKRGEDSQLNLE